MVSPADSPKTPNPKFEFIKKEENYVKVEVTFSNGRSYIFTLNGIKVGRAEDVYVIFLAMFAKFQQLEGKQKSLKANILDFDKEKNEVKLKFKDKEKPYTFNANETYESLKQKETLEHHEKVILSVMSLFNNKIKDIKEHKNQIVEEKKDEKAQVRKPQMSRKKREDKVESEEKIEVNQAKPKRRYSAPPKLQKTKPKNKGKEPIKRPGSVPLFREKREGL